MISDVIFIQLTNTTIFLDAHGVLVDSSKMIKNYERTLIQLFSQYLIPSEQAIDFHNQGLDLYLKLLNEIKGKKLTGNEFLQAMEIADKKWDSLLQSFVTTANASELESRNVEYLAGSLSDTFYRDGKEFLYQIQNQSLKRKHLKIRIITIRNCKK